MKIYLAGYGHAIEKTPFVEYLSKNGWNVLFTYFSILKNRWNYVVKEKDKNENKPPTTDRCARQS